MASPFSIDMVRVLAGLKLSIKIIMPVNYPDPHNSNFINWFKRAGTLGE
jgi:hypothetical protein